MKKIFIFAVLLSCFGCATYKNGNWKRNPSSIDEPPIAIEAVDCKGVVREPLIFVGENQLKVDGALYKSDAFYALTGRQMLTRFVATVKPSEISGVGIDNYKTCRYFDIVVRDPQFFPYISRLKTKDAFGFVISGNQIQISDKY